MGNSCAHGKSSDEGFLSSVSRSLWPSKPPEIMIDYSKDDDTSVKIRIQNQIQNQDARVTSPELMIDYSKDDDKSVKIRIQNQIQNEDAPVTPPELMKIEESGEKKSSENDSRFPEVKKIEEESGEEKVSEIPKMIMIVQERAKPKRKSVKKKMSLGLEVDSVLKSRTGNLKQRFDLGSRIGHGQFGTTFICNERETGKDYACKSIAKRKLKDEDDLEDVRREIEILHHLYGHPHVVSIEGAYEDAVAVHVVMELCKGGELFDRIVKRGHYSEKKAAELTGTMVGVIEACHALGVMHRDLKPENFLFVNEDEDSPMKIIDFGLSVFFKPGDVFIDVVGSPYYVAPEVLYKRYGIEADVWSVGVIVYILLCGTPPFSGETEQEIFEDVLRGDIDFSSDPWPNISESAKDLVKRMLVRDPRKRITAHEALQHPWVKEHGVANDKPLDSAVLSRMTQFSAMTKLKKMAIRVIAENLCEEELVGLTEMFKTIDTDNTGFITFEQLKNGIKRCGAANLDESEIYDLMKAADINNNGTIDYGEFIAATLHLNKIEKDHHLVKAFSYFDRDGSGYITKDELQRACEEFGIHDFPLEEMIKEADQNNDGRIDYEEFVAMMHKGNRDFGKKKFKNNFGVEFREVMPVC